MTDLPAGLPEGAEPTSAVGFNQHVGPLYRLPALENGAILRFCFIAAAHHLNAGGAVHGGMMMTFVDISMGRATKEVTGCARMATVTMNTDFLAPGRLGDVVESRVRVTRQTRTMAFLAVEVVAGERLLVQATGTMKIARPEA